MCKQLKNQIEILSSLAIALKESDQLWVFPVGPYCTNFGHRFHVKATSADRNTDFLSSHLTTILILLLLLLLLILLLLLYYCYVVQLLSYTTL